MKFSFKEHGKKVLIVGVLSAGLALSACGAPGANSNGDPANAETTATAPGSQDMGEVGLFLTEDALDSTIVGSYTYEGASEEITARQALETYGGLESQKRDDGTYYQPSAEMILLYARAQVLNTLVEKNNIKIDDEEVAEFLANSFGGASIDDIAQQFQMSKEEAERIIKESAAAYKLSEQINGKIPDEPEAPFAPEQGQEAKATEGYAEYAKKFIGDEWDAENNTWAKQDGPYYEALKDFTFDGKTADYNFAQAVYYVAYGQWTDESKEMTQAWTDFINAEYAKANIQIASIIQ
ncbi:MAG: hypothetical protein Q4E22_00875 [Coriobacteriia bacterium]|nr:hypothetical protein [Coriobacteriia bacterium]